MMAKAKSYYQPTKQELAGAPEAFRYELDGFKKYVELSYCNLTKDQDIL